MTWCPSLLSPPSRRPYMPYNLYRRRGHICLPDHSGAAANPLLLTHRCTNVTCSNCSSIQIAKGTRWHGLAKDNEESWGTAPSRVIAHRQPRHLSAQKHWVRFPYTIHSHHLQQTAFLPNISSVNPYPSHIKQVFQIVCGNVWDRKTSASARS